MLEMKKAAVSFDESDLMELEVIVTDGDEKGALRFVKRAVYDRISHSQQGKLKSHLNGANPVEGFTRNSQ
jgi:hypothetical protein